MKENENGTYMQTKREENKQRKRMTEKRMGEKESGRVAESGRRRGGAEKKLSRMSCKHLMAYCAVYTQRQSHAYLCVFA